MIQSNAIKGVQRLGSDMARQVSNKHETWSKYYNKFGNKPVVAGILVATIGVAVSALFSLFGGEEENRR